LEQANAMGVGKQEAPLLAVRGITKRFGNFTANDNVTLGLTPGEVHALLGENGAGKSTLVKMLYGLLAPTEGEILWKGEPIKLANPNAARALGIGMVFQHFSLFDNLTVAENIALVMPPSDKLQDVPGKIEEISRAYGMGMEPNRPVWSLSAGERQRIELRTRLGAAHPKLLRVVTMMEQSIARFVPMNEFAASVALSSRQLERLFRRHIGRPPSQHYLRIRLEHSCQLLRQTAMPILSVAMASGFNSASHFSSSYVEHFGHSPSAERKSLGAGSVSHGRRK